jgi:hypothetical protein
VPLTFDANYWELGLMQVGGHGYRHSLRMQYCGGSAVLVARLDRGAFREFRAGIGFDDTDTSDEMDRDDLFIRVEETFDAPEDFDATWRIIANEPVPESGLRQFVAPIDARSRGLRLSAEGYAQCQDVDWVDPFVSVSSSP